MGANNRRRRTVAQIIKDGVSHMTVEQRLAALEGMIGVLITKHNGLADDWEKRSDHHGEWIEALILDTLDLHTSIYGPDPETDQHPDIVALRRKHCAEMKFSNPRDIRPRSFTSLRRATKTSSDFLWAGAVGLTAPQF
jgi:hypothetical protein